jgi:hypothetical protein
MKEKIVVLLHREGDSVDEGLHLQAEMHDPTTCRGSPRRFGVEKRLFEALYKTFIIMKHMLSVIEMFYIIKCCYDY